MIGLNFKGADFIEPLPFLWQFLYCVEFVKNPSDPAYSLLVLNNAVAE